MRSRNGIAPKLHDWRARYALRFSEPRNGKIERELTSVYGDGGVSRI